jgi:hypothetical protein
VAGQAGTGVIFLSVFSLLVTSLWVLLGGEVSMILVITKVLGTAWDPMLLVFSQKPQD